MAKKKAPKAPCPGRDDFERAMRLAIAEVPGVADMSEAEYCEEVAAACEAIASGVKMRLEELAEEAKDGSAE
jgi:hypothetical protein